MATEEFEQICKDAIISAATLLTKKVLTKAPENLGVRFVVILQTRTEEGLVHSGAACSANSADVNESNDMIRQICQSMLARANEPVEAEVLDITPQIHTHTNDLPLDPLRTERVFLYSVTS